MVILQVTNRYLNPFIPRRTGMEIIHFEDRYAADFRKLNMEWLQHYNLTEAHDLEILDDPRGTITDSGGVLFLAREEDTIAGCAGLMKVDSHEYELVKMAVAAPFRGRGISKLLLTRCLEEARTLQARRITLLSNHQLTTALALYRRFGFKDIPVGTTVFELADVKMELVLDTR